MKEKRTSIILYETLTESILSDCFTFGLLAAMFYINKAYLDAAIPGWVLACMFLLSLFAKASNVGKKFHAAQDAHDFIDYFYKTAPSPNATPSEDKK